MFVLMALILSGSLAYAESVSTGGGASGGGGGSVQGTVVSAPMVTFTAKGTINLPSGFVAPNGGLKIYGGFGGVTFQNISAANLSQSVSSGGYTAYSESDTTEYEKFDAVATIPQGKSSVNFEKTFSVAKSADAFYGEFWIYDTDVLSSDGSQYLSNKMTASSIITVKADKYDYTGVDVMLTAAENKVDYALEFDEGLAAEKPNQTVFLIADDGYDKYITKRDINACNESVSGKIRTENGNYELYGYIPASDLLENQKLATGIGESRNVNFNEVNTITVKKGNYIAGTVSKPSDDENSGEVKLKITTLKATVNVTILQGQSGTEFVVGAESGWEQLNIEVLNTNLYKSGYLWENEFLDYEDDYAYITVPLENVAITLQKQCVISGKIFLPQNVSMAEKTWFMLYIEAENKAGTYSDRKSVRMFSDKECTYKISIPYEFKDDSFIIKYYYSKDAFEFPDFPSKPKNPLKSWKSSSGSSGGSGGSGGSSATSGYTKEMPEGLLEERQIYCKLNGGTFYKSEAYGYEFTENALNADITLAKEGEIPYKNAIGGYFTDVLSLGENVTLTLLNAETNTEKYSKTISGGKYIFEDIEDGEYIISAKYNGKTYYWTGTRLSKTVAAAKIINTEETPVVYGNDMYYDNIFPANICCSVKCIINGEEQMAEVGIYDIYGNCRRVYDFSEDIYVNFSPFVLSIDGSFVSTYDIRDCLYIKEINDDFKKSAKITADFYDAIDKMLGYGEYNEIVAELENVKLFDYTIGEKIIVDDNYVTASVRKNIENVESDTTDTIYWAAYSDGKLVDLVKDGLVMEKGKEQITSSKPLNIKQTTGSKIKVLIWKEKNIPAAKFKEALLK